ncbi:MAG: DNA recombination protein RmuC [Gammaproteobacteria bacterium]|nr:DNA recombination protein RmuC [Gammaproteobacteria bacterium]
MDNINITTAVLLLTGMILGALVAYIFALRYINKLREQLIQTTTLLHSERHTQQEKITALHQARDQLAATFSQLSSAALKHNSEEFLRLAQENLKQFQTKAQGELEQKEKAIEHLVKPIREALDKTEKQIHTIEKDRKEAYGALYQQLQHMAHTQEALHSQTQNLVNALRRPEVRGQWGEMTLKRLAELSGMVQYCDFVEQENTDTESGRQRPDMIVRMPDRREIVVDVKTPLDAYLSAIEASDAPSREQHLQRHARNVRQRINELSNKAYWSQFENSPDFVVLFIPGEHFLTAALDQDRSLIEDALRKQIILATPTSFVALLRAIGYGWRQEQLSQNAEQIRSLGVSLYERLNTFATHLQKLGNSLENSVKSYNSAVASFDSRVLPNARKFGELGITTGKQLDDPQQIETAVKQIENE